MRVGFIGLGIMGKPMSQNLLKAGFPLTVYNRTRSKAEELVRAGAEEASSPAEVARRCDVILACLGTVAASEEVFLGKEGVVANARPEQVLVDHSTIGLGTVRKIARTASAKGAAFLDAPISGGFEAAQQGALTIMVGGEKSAFERAFPVFQAMGKNVRWVGDSGAGCVVKLVNQHLTAIHVVAAAEAMVLGTKAGADPQVMYDLLHTSWGYSRMLERSVPRFINRDFSPKGPLRLVWKDVALIEELGREVVAPLALLRSAKELYRQAVEAGLEDKDVTCVVLPLERQAGVVVGSTPGGAHS